MYTLSFHLIFIVLLTYFQETSGGVSRIPVEYGVGLSVKRVNNFPLCFVAESSILDLVVVLDASLEINCVYIYKDFMKGVNSLYIKFVNMT